MATTMAAVAAAGAQEAKPDLMTPETLWQLGRIGHVTLSPSGESLLFNVTHYSKEANKGTSTFYTLGLKQPGDVERQCRRTLKGSKPTFLRDGKRFLFLAPGGKLCLTPTSNLNADKDMAELMRPLADNVDDYLLSPDERHIIVVRMVPSTASIAAPEADLPEATGMVINDLMYKHWDHYVDQVPHPFLYEFDGEKLVGEPTDLLEGEPYECPMEPFGGAEQLCFSPDGKQIAYTCRKKTGRDYAISTDSDIYLYDIAKKRTVRNLCKPEAYGELERDPLRSLEHQAVNAKGGADCNMGYDTNPQFSPDGNFVAWLSMERDGYESDRQRLCLYHLNTGTKRYITEQFESGVDEFLWAPSGHTLYFTGVWHGKTNVYRTNIEGDVVQLTDDQADYGLCAISPDGHTLYVKRHSMEVPDDIYRLALPEARIPQSGQSDTNSLGRESNAVASLYRLTEVNRDIYRTLAVGKCEERWVKTVDGKDMLCWVVYPPHFDPAKKYPALLFCEGGPQSPVSQFWSYRWNFQIMAANGYVVIAPNRRGLPGFGMEWLEEISGDYTGLCMQDYLSAIDDLARESYIDNERLGAVGASFGGFSVYWLAGNHDKRFKAFIAHDGIYNTQQQYVETEEMWFPNWDLKSAPWLKAADGQVQKAFAESPHLYVDRWDTPILCIHGQRDFRIEYTQAESAFNAARMRGIDAQLLLFPDENHWVLKPQNGILWQRTFFRFLDKYLKH